MILVAEWVCGLDRDLILVMSNFIALRLILQEPKPDVRQFVE